MGIREGISALTENFTFLPDCTVSLPGLFPTKPPE